MANLIHICIRPSHSNPWNINYTLKKLFIAFLPQGRGVKWVRKKGDPQKDLSLKRKSAKKKLKVPKKH
jgi:hypothetical protein